MDSLLCQVHRSVSSTLPLYTARKLSLHRDCFSIVIGKCLYRIMGRHPATVGPEHRKHNQAICWTHQGCAQCSILCGQQTGGQSHLTVCKLSHWAAYCRRPASPTCTANQMPFSMQHDSIIAPATDVTHVAHHMECKHSQVCLCSIL